MSTDRDDAIKIINSELRRRSGKAWSVTGGRGTAWGWITIDTPPARRKWDFYEGKAPQEEHGHMSKGERQELAELLGLDRDVHPQGASIAASSDYYREYIDRAEGREPSVVGEPYWD